MKNQDVSKKLEVNIQWWKDAFSDCADVKMLEMCLGEDMSVRTFLSYIEVTGGESMLEKSTIGNLLSALTRLPGDEVIRKVRENGMGVSDAVPFASMQEAADGMLAGECILFFDGFDRAVKIPDKGYPAMSLQEVESEKSVRGSNERFSNSVKQNAALIRKRIRSADVKVREHKMGVRSNTNLYIVWYEGLIYPEFLEEMERRLSGFCIDGVQDIGVIQQLSEKYWYSPFPQFQVTERPDRAAMAILEGRMVVLLDNSPEALIFPTDYNSFIKTTDDYYSRWEIASFTRILRYLASFFAMVLPGLYLAVTNFHTQILPTRLLLSFAATRQGVPFPGVIEILLMELSFELLREAGVRLPGAMGNTIGIVGGLIIGQAAVDANIVSPMVVIIVAFTALCSFAIPNEDFATAFRLLKFAFIGLCAAWGYYGFLIGLLFVLIHLAQLESFGMPYFTPFVGADLSKNKDTQDTFIRPPAELLTRRPIYANRKNRVRMRIKRFKDI
ncbi:MAG: spore germination protein [Clostridiales bacterium]|nr:spore germination protein [Clostridiales bacterium]